MNHPVYYLRIFALYRYNIIPPPPKKKCIILYFNVGNGSIQFYRFGELVKTITKSSLYVWGETPNYITNN